jgi:hypothetical protein
MNINLEQFIGYSFDEVEEELVSRKLSFKVVEVWDRKRTKLGDDLRVIKIKTEPEIQIFVSYF